MVAIQVRDVPDAVRDALSAEAERRGQSLQLFLTDVLAQEAASARNLAWVRAARARGTTDQAAGDLAPTGRETIRETWRERDDDIVGSRPPAAASRR